MSLLHLEPNLTGTPPPPPYRQTGVNSNNAEEVTVQVIHTLCDPRDLSKDKKKKKATGDFTTLLSIRKNKTKKKRGIH